MSNVTHLLSRIEEGDQQASEDLLPLVYDELRRLAAAKMASERPEHTLQATALVNEAYLRLVGSEHSQMWKNRGHFFSAAAESMRRILIDHARRKDREKRGGDRRRVDLDDVVLFASEGSQDMIALDEALAKLAHESPVKAKLVELRFFAGLTHQEAAQALGISRASADRYWAYSKLFLYAEIEDAEQKTKNSEIP